MQSYVGIANAPSVIDPVIQGLKLNLTSRRVASKVGADALQVEVLIYLQGASQAGTPTTVAKAGTALTTTDAAAPGG